MRNLFILLVFWLSPIVLTSQVSNSIIEGQIIGYKGEESLKYSLKNFYGGVYNATTPIDSLGRFRIKSNSDNIQFFVLYYGQDTLTHTCRLVIEPGNQYYFVSKGIDRNEWKINYSPIIYKNSIESDIKNSSFTLDKASMFYNLIDNGTSGHLYQYEWDMNYPDSLLHILERKINSGLSTLNQMLELNEISPEFYKIAKLNLEYTQAYRLAQTISDVWFNKKYIDIDSANIKKLLTIYPKIFEIYPVNKDVPFDKHYAFSRYIDQFLDYLSSCDDGIFYPKKRSRNYYIEYIEKAEPYLNNNAYSFYRLSKSMSSLVALSPNSLEVAKKIIAEQPNFDANSTFYFNQVLIPKAESFESLSELDFPSDVLILDGDSTINSFETLRNIVGDTHFIIDFWGTWCMPCRYQIQFQKDIDPLLEKYGIKKVFIAVQHGSPKETWERFLKTGSMKGYHFVANDRFLNDFASVVVPIDKFPKYVLIDSSGKLIDSDLPYPSNKKELKYRIENYFKR